MRKTAVSVTVTTAVLGVFGAFLRWLQNTGAFEKTTGCLIPHHPTTIVFLIYCALAVAVIFVITLAWLRRYDSSADAAALRSATVLPTVLGWVLAVVFALCACLIMFAADRSRFPTAQRMLGAFGILAGLCLPFLPGKKDGSIHSLGRTAAAVLTLFCCYWLVFLWRLHMEDPVVWGFVMEILAVAATTVAFYYVASFHFGAGRSSRALLAIQLAVFCDITTLFDAREATQSALILICTVVLLLMEAILVENMWEKRDA